MPAKHGPRSSGVRLIGTVLTATRYAGLMPLLSGAVVTNHPLGYRNEMPSPLKPVNGAEAAGASAPAAAARDPAAIPIATDLRARMPRV